MRRRGELHGRSGRGGVAEGNQGFKNKEKNRPRVRTQGVEGAVWGGQIESGSRRAILEVIRKRFESGGKEFARVNKAGGGGRERMGAGVVERLFCSCCRRRRVARAGEGLNRISGE